jgi:hypothetical protein
MFVYIYIFILHFCNGPSGASSSASKRAQLARRSAARTVAETLGMSRPLGTDPAWENEAVDAMVKDWRAD